MNSQLNETTDDGWSRISSELSGVGDCDGSSGWSVVSAAVASDWDSCSVLSDFKISYRDALMKKSSSVTGVNQQSDCGLPSKTKLIRRNQKHEEKQSQNCRTHSDAKLYVAYHDWGMLDAKPFKEKLRSKHESAGRRRNLHGHTGRRSPDECHSHEYSHCNPVLQGGSDNMLTSIELNRGNARSLRNRQEWETSLNKSRGWEELPAILESECVEAPQKTETFSRYEGHRSVTSYKLKPKILLREGKSSKASDQEERLIYHKPPPTTSTHNPKFIPRKVFAEIDPSQPKLVKGSQMAWRIKNKRRVRKGVPTVHSKYSWDVQEDCLWVPGGWGTRPFLEIDLGHSAAVTAISTQGAPPPVRIYPEVRKPRPYDGFYTVEGHQHEGKYDGPFWRVLDPDWFNQSGRSDTECRDRRVSELRWVRSYELWWRADRGRTWNPLGVFKGNDDTTTERAHLLTGFQSGSLCCRYLRIVPIDCVNGGAMRFGVYGEDSRVQSLATRSTKSHVSDRVEDEDALVEYKLYEPSGMKASGTDQRDVLAPGYGKCFWHDGRPSRSKLKVEANQLDSSE